MDWNPLDSPVFQWVASASALATFGATAVADPLLTFVGGGTLQNIMDSNPSLPKPLGISNLNSTFSPIATEAVIPIFDAGQSAIFTYVGAIGGAYVGTIISPGAGSVVGAAGGEMAGAWLSSWVAKEQEISLGTPTTSADQWAVFVGSAVGSIGYAVDPNLLSASTVVAAPAGSTTNPLQALSDSQAQIDALNSTNEMEAEIANFSANTQPTLEAGVSTIGSSSWTTTLAKYGQDFKNLSATVASDWKTITATSSAYLPLMPKTTSTDTTTSSGGTSSPVSSQAGGISQAGMGIAVLALVFALREFS